MFEKYLNHLSTQLISTNPESVNSSIDEIVESREALIDVVLSAWQVSLHRYLIAERLPKLGLGVIPPLKKVISKSEDYEIKILGSLVLSQMDSLDDYDCLEEEIEKNGEYACLALRKLALRDEKKAIDFALGKLRLFDSGTLTNEIEGLVICYLSFLVDVAEGIPEDIRLKYSSSAVSIRLLVQNSMNH